jgi:hypothetical protein
MGWGRKQRLAKKEIQILLCVFPIFIKHKIYKQERNGQTSLLLRKPDHFNRRHLEEEVCQDDRTCAVAIL